MTAKLISRTFASPQEFFLQKIVFDTSPVAQPVRTERPGSPVLSLVATTMPLVETESSENEDGRPLSVYVRFCALSKGRTGGKAARLRVMVPPIIPAAQMRDGQKYGPSSTLPRSLVRFTHGWYSTRDLSDRELVLAMMSVLPQDAVLAGETAAALYGVEVRPTSSYGTAFKICVARPEGNRALRRPGVRCRVVRLAPGDVIVIDGVRRTSPLRTVIDMAAAETIEIATHLVERFLALGYFTRKQLRKRIRELRGYRGIRTLRRALKLAMPASESVFETAVRIRLREVGLPQFRPQVKVHCVGRRAPLRVDLGLELGKPGKAGHIRLGVECDSEKYHPLFGPKARADEERRRTLQREGWTILSVRFPELRGQTFTFEASIARLLGVQLAPDKRIPWRRSRWTMRRNAWTR